MVEWLHQPSSAKRRGLRTCGKSLRCESRQGLFLSAVAGGVDVAGMDKTVAPGDDFNGYCSGNWAKATPIPPDKPVVGLGGILDEAQKRTETVRCAERSIATKCSGK